MTHPAPGAWTEPDRPLRAVLADDHELVRSGFSALLAQIGVLVVAEAGDGWELVELVDRHRPDIVFTDIAMPGRDGISAIVELHRRYPSMRLVVISMFASVDFVRRAVDCGACGYIVKDALPRELDDCIRMLVATGSYFSPAIEGSLHAASDRDHGLSERQVQIVRLIACGKTSRAIGSELGLSPCTVDAHRNRIMEQLNLRDVASLTRYALRMGFIIG